MNVSKNVMKKVKAKKEGEIITYDEFAYLENFNAVALALSRLNKSGYISRLSKGVYYKPKKTSYGPVKPNENEILKKILLKNNKGYISGAVAFNKLGLSTQVPNTIEIRGSYSSRLTKIGKLRIKYKKSNIEFKSDDVNLLQLLDSLQDIKKIPDTNVNEVYVRIKERILGLGEERIKRLAQLSKDRRPQVRALVGSILDEEKPDLAKPLFKSLNSLSVYKIGLREEIVPNKKKWKIK